MTVTTGVSFTAHFFGVEVGFGEGWGVAADLGLGVADAALYTALAPVASIQSALPINALKIRTVAITIPVMRLNSGRVGQITFFNSEMTCAK
jgi:hypothetical protein